MVSRTSENKFAPTKTLSDGMAVVRRADSGLKVVTSRLLLLKQEQYPDLEIRQSSDPKRAPGVQEVAPMMVRRQRGKLGHLASAHTIRTIYEEVPSLREKMPVVFDTVDTTVERRETPATYIVIVPDEASEAKLEEEKDAVYRVLGRLGGNGEIYWHDRNLDMTLVFLKYGSAPGLLEDALTVVEDSLPLSVTLAPAKIQ